MAKLLCFVLLALALNFNLLANERKPDKINIQKLLGKWKASATKDTYQSVIEFRKDGTMTNAIRIKGEDYLLEGSYRIDGYKVLIRLKDDIEFDEVYLVHKLTDAEMSWTYEKSKEKEIRTRLKDK